MYHVWTDMPLTRRKAVHHIYDGDGQHRATHQKLSDAMVWLWENDQFDAMFHIGDQRWRVRVDYDGTADDDLPPWEAPPGVTDP